MTRFRERCSVEVDGVTETEVRMEGTCEETKGRVMVVPRGGGGNDRELAPLDLEFFWDVYS